MFPNFRMFFLQEPISRLMLMRVLPVTSSEKPLHMVCSFIQNNDRYPVRKSVYIDRFTEALVMIDLFLVLAKTTHRSAKMIGAKGRKLLTLDHLSPVFAAQLPGTTGTLSRVLDQVR